MLRTGRTVSLSPVPSLPRGTVISVVKNPGTWVVGLACPACPEPVEGSLSKGNSGRGPGGLYA